jgi:RHS repeat-associated protein
MLLAALLSLSFSTSYAKEGDSMSNPIVAGIYSSDFSYTNTANTHEYTNLYIGRSTSDVYHRFTLTITMNVTITHDGSSLQDTYMTLIDSNGNMVESNNDYFGSSHCQDSCQSFIQKQLSAGTYYIVSEGFTSDGIIKINITGNTSSEYGYTYIPSTYDTNSGTAVGGMGGHFGISPMGGATYSIPIEVPVGVGGLQPQLSIVYNSQAKNSLVGYGFNMLGFSSITRGAKDLYHDGITKGISFNDDDALFLNGVRLILVSGTAGQNDARYNPESDPFTDVIFHAENSSPSDFWFEVQSSDGMKYYYSTIQSFTSNGTQKIYAWYLSRAIQPTGNYINYYYDGLYSQDKTCLFLYPIMISYGTNLNDHSSVLSNVIQFSYETRDDVIPIRFEGKYGNMYKRLKTITCKTNDKLFRTYSFNYDTTGDGSGTQYSRLTSVIEINNEKESLTTLFSWSYLPSPSNNTNSVTVNQPTNIPSRITLDYDNQAFFSGDMNGDGADDLISITPATRVDNGWTSHFNILNFHYSYLNNGNRVFSTSPSVGDFFEVDWLGSFAGLTNKLKGEIVTDFDGDGINECVLPVFLQSEGYPDHLRIQVLGKNICDSQDWSLQAKGEPLTTTADINNDGKGDLVVLESFPNNNNEYRLRIYQMKDNYVRGSHSICKYVEASLSIPDRPIKLYATDMNNNGVSDLLVVYNTGYTIFWNQGNCTFSQSSYTDSKDCILDNLCEVGDFDGDGLMDFLTNKAGSYIWYFHLNCGNGSFNKIPAMTFSLCNQDFTKYDDDKFHFDVFDFDGDGKSDIVVTKADYLYNSFLWEEWGDFSKTHTYWFKSSGTSLIEVSHASSNNENDAYPSRFTIGDYDGDGRVELINYGYDCSNTMNSFEEPSWHIYKTNSLSAQSGKVVSITGDLGMTTSITYGILTDPDVYSLTSRDLYPTQNIVTPLVVVKQTIEDNGAAGSQTTLYTYENLKVHLRGRGVMGFSKMIANNTTMDYVIENGVSQWDSAYFIPKKTYSKQMIGSLNSQTITSFMVEDKGQNNYFSYPSQIVEKDMDNNTVTTITHYDSIYGYLTDETVSYGTKMYRSVSCSNYVYKGGAYKPQTISTIQCHPDDSNIFSNTVAYIYDDNGFIISRTQNAGSSKPLTTSYTYDLWGNVTSESCSGLGVPLFTTYYNYDRGTHRFPIRISTDPVSSVKKYTYDIWGNTLTECDSVNSLVCCITEHTYDGWGNLTRTLVPGNGSVSYTRGWGSDTGKSFFILEQGSARPWVKKWYDNQGREVLIESVGPNDVAIKKDLKYNSKGLVTNTVQTNGTLTISTVYTYDSRGRVLSETSSSGSSKQYQYGNLSVSTISNNSTTYKRYDAMGNIKEVVDPVSSVNYYYSSNGNVNKIKTQGITYRYEYDELGNKISSTDPDAGKTTFTYDALGRETSHTDSRNILFTTNYDVFGRITSKTAGSETITYLYGTSGNGQMRLIKKTLGNWSNTYEYDQYGRIVSQNVGGHTTKYQYNSIGLLSRKTWADIDNSRFVDYLYDPYGNNIGSKAISGTVEWNLLQYTGTTTSSTIRLNSSLFTRTTTRNSDGYQASYSLSRGNTVLNGEAYTYDHETGNLIQCIKSDATTLGYSYDSIDRLTRFTKNDNEQMSISYAPNGNITNKSDIGNYSYNKSKKHMITSVSNDNNLISYNSQYVTYNDWGKVAEINETKGNDTYKYELVYGPDLQRVLAVLWKNGNLVHLVTYGDEYEEKYQDGDITRYYYINGADGNTAVYTSDTRLGDKAYCIDHDYLGSITRLYDQNGIKCFGAKYDPWGRREIDAGSIEYDRGFTGHEHIDELPLIDMNGRMYDPLLGRFISVDKYYQSPYCAQGFNPYAYCMNNPLKYTDPDGEFGILAAYLIAAASSAMIDYSIQVAFNLGSGLTGKDAFFNKVDFFDIGVSAIMGACNAGLANIKKIGKLGKLALNVGSIGLTSAIDITGEGKQKVSIEKCVTRIIIGAATYAASDAIGNMVTQKSTAKNAPQIESRPQPEPQANTKIQSQLNTGEGYPPNQGAVPGTEMEIWLESGQKLDRYGKTSEKSHYLSPVGTDYPSRSLNLKGDVTYEIFEVTKPFVAESSVILPWYGQPGMGYQINTFIPIKDLIKKGYLKEIHSPITIRF